jgi:hypothetical protein
MFLPQVILPTLSDPTSHATDSQDPVRPKHRRDPKKDDIRAGPIACPAADEADLQGVNLQLQEQNGLDAAIQKVGVENVF